MENYIPYVIACLFADALIIITYYIIAMYKKIISRLESGFDLLIQRQLEIGNSVNFMNKTQDKLIKQDNKLCSVSCEILKSVGTNSEKIGEILESKFYQSELEMNSYFKGVEMIRNDLANRMDDFLQEQDYILKNLSGNSSQKTENLKDIFGEKSDSES